MNILVINCGSSSIKYKLYAFPEERTLARGLIEKIGEPGSSIPDHGVGVKKLFDNLLEEKAIKFLDEIDAIGHRVLHGGETLRDPCIIDTAVKQKIKECIKFGPLHNPGNLAGINACTKALKNVPQVAVFDTGFHKDIPDYAYMYALPYKYYKKYKIRKYGFHGTSHQYVAQKAAETLGKPLSSLNLITCHLGNGCSIAAVKKGKCVDTSMGLTPLAGLLMGTRSGDVDMAGVLYLMHKEHLSAGEVDDMLNKKSGFKGVSGLSNDIRDIKKAIKEGNERAKLALNMFIYRIEEYIGSYWFVLGGADAIVFTGGIGENNPEVIGRIKKDISPAIGDETRVMVVPTDEELMIAKLTYELTV